MVRQKRYRIHWNWYESGPEFHRPFLQEETAPMTTGFVFCSLAMVASSKPRCALTSSGGVKASH